jgi:GTP1/Obg family GTP-binding protein
MKESSEQFKLAVASFSNATSSMDKLASTMVEMKKDADAKFSSSMEVMSTMAARFEDIVKSIKSDQKTKSKSKLYRGNNLFSL